MSGFTWTDRNGREHQLELSALMQDEADAVAVEIDGYLPERSFRKVASVNVV